MIFDAALEPQFTVSSRPDELLLFLPFGYLLTVLIESPVLLVGLTRQLSWRQRLFAGFWLTACTYPIVVLVMPMLFASSSRALYLLVAETFAPVAECVLFWLAFRQKLAGSGWMLRSFAAIIVANVLSFVVGEVFVAAGWFGFLN